MAFDGGFLRAHINEINEKLSGARVDKIYQTSGYEIVLLVRAADGNYRLLISAAAESARVQITGEKAENPQTPPMFCMLLRKHLCGGKLRGVIQRGLDRCCEFIFDITDELGDRAVRKLQCEITGRNSNIIFCDGEDKIISPLRSVDLSMSRVRAVLPGIEYSAPPLGGKKEITEETPESFEEVLGLDSPESEIMKRYTGISPLIAREIVCRCRTQGVKEGFNSFIKILSGNFTPALVTQNGRSEVCYLEPVQYGSSAEIKIFDSFGSLTDFFYSEKDKRERIAQKSADIRKICTAAESRIMRKLDIRRTELAQAERKDEYKNKGDLITANIYKLKGGEKYIRVTDYTADPPAEVTLEVDPSLSPSSNAQKYYKKYSKLKKAQTVLVTQIANGEAELEYIRSVLSSLESAEGIDDISEIREELRKSGYISHSGGKEKKQKKEKRPEPMEFQSSGGFRILCGKNNTQNDYVRSLGRGSDYWFHAHNMPGSHVGILAEGREVPDADKEEAALIAAVYSASGGRDRTEVDYTPLREVKHPTSSAPGYVIYHKYQTASILPDKERFSNIKRIK